jgi:hypothetical protein
LSRWLFAGDEAAFELRPDLDNLDALAPDREALWARLDGAGFLTQDEKRAAAGYGAVGAAAKFNPYHDEAGRFTFAPGGGGDKPADSPTPTPRIGEPGDPRVTPVAAPPRGPKGPPPVPTPKPQTTSPSKPPPRDPSKEPLKDILMPGGKEIGVRNPGASGEVRTVSKSELDQIKSQVLSGATETVSPPSYAGKWYQRSDGTVVGIRESKDFGTTVEVVRSNDPLLKQGYKVHGQ